MHDTKHPSPHRALPAVTLTLMLTLAFALAGCASPALAQQRTAPAPPPSEQRDEAPNENAQPQDDEKQPAPLPLKRAVMFSSGVGYFEHVGTITGDTNVRLMFQKSQINDVLKSMVVMDTGGGRVTRASYPTKDPIERTLASFAVDLSGKPTLPELLDQLRGSRITVHAPNAVTGRIVSIEKRTKVHDDTKTIEHRLTIATEQGVRGVVLENIDRLQLDDPSLQSELNKALTTLAGARDTQRRPVTLRFEGEGERTVRIGYLIETPVWKTSYRLDLSDLAAGDAEADAQNGENDADNGDKAMLQGWAMVENMTESDWQNVQLSLVSGQPISYQMDLYTPLYTERPSVKIPRYAQLKPRMYGEGMKPKQQAKQLAQQRADEARNEAGRRKQVAAEMMRSRAAAPSAAADAAEGAGAAQLGESVQASTQTASIGELFRFTLDHPVSIDRRQSAMLPIVTDRVEANKVSIYNQQENDEHPRSGVELTNSTDLQLLAGPVTVLDGGMYAGDALIDHMTPGEKRLLSYAVDLSVTVDPSRHSSQHITAAKIVRGVLQLTRRQDYRQTYRIKNKADETRTLIVEHPFNNSRELVKPEKPYEKTPKWYRFRVDVEADTTGAFVVQEQRTYHQSIALLNRPVNEFLGYAKSGAIDDDVREALRKAAEMKQQLTRLQNQRNQRQSELNEIKGGQERLRRNIGSVGRDSQLGKRYVRKLADQEDEIEQLQQTIADLQSRIEAQQDKLAAYLNDLNVQ